MWSIDFTPSVQNTCGAIFLLSTRIGFTWLISSFFPYKTSPRWASATNWSLFSLAEAVYKSQYCPPSIVFPSSAIFVQKKKSGRNVEARAKYKRNGRKNVLRKLLTGSNQRLVLGGILSRLVLISITQPILGDWILATLIPCGCWIDPSASKYRTTGEMEKKSIGRELVTLE